MADKHVEVSEEMSADAGTVYDLVSDLTQMGRWSPENTGGRWVGGATGPAKGARFRGRNAWGWRRWSTSVEVTEAERGKRFAFRVTSGPLPVSEWSYDFEASDAGTRVTESWDDLRPGWMDVTTRWLLGVSDRAEHNRRNMQETLAALKRGAETAG